MHDPFVITEVVRGFFLKRLPIQHRFEWLGGEAKHGNSEALEYDSILERILWSIYS